MSIFENVYDIIITVALLIIMLLASMRINRLFGLGDRKGLYIFLWHTFFTIFYMYYTFHNTSDAMAYYSKSLDIQNYTSFALGTKFVVYFTSLFSLHLKFSYLNCFLIYSFLGYIGLLAFAGSLNKAIVNQSKVIKTIAWTIVFLPTVSFWTSAIGKDSIAFLASGLALWCALNFRERILLFFTSIILMLLVRPHIAAILMLSFALSSVFDKKISILKRFFIGSIASGCMVVLIPLTLNYTGIGEVSDASDVEDYISQRQESNLEGGSSVDIASMSFPMQIFTYLFRPLPFEAHSLFSLLASFDNLILFLVLILGLKGMLNKNKPYVDSNRYFLWIFVFISLVSLAITTANLGIAMRQKWMFLPMFIFLLISVAGNNIRVKL